MLPTSVRFALALVLFILGTFLMSFGRIEGLFMVVAALYWLYTSLRFGPVKVAFVAYRRGQLDRAEELIDGVRWPKLLTRRLRPYFYWVRGAVAGHKGDLDAAYDDYRTAYEGRLRDESDRAVLAALLAEIDVMRGDLASAREHLSAARTLKHREDLDPFLDELERRAAA